LVSRPSSTRDNRQLLQLVLDRARGLIREDATGRLRPPYLTMRATTFSYFEATRVSGAVRRPVAFCSAGARVFRSTASQKKAQRLALLAERYTH
ncbi:hypothetical protein M3620_10715, partial [Rothia dentocariosa]|uniref:hypothetical protein n=1 Tax=Rothia dentocariosa TaxID=2047 RepID=UPI00203A6C51